jgi:hypothetical protein
MNLLLKAEEDRICCSLTYTQRVYGFVICCGLGLILASIAMVMLFATQIISFSILYTFGNVFMLAATFFLFGPMKQLQKMFESYHQAIAVACYILLMILTLVVAFTIANGLLCLLLVVFQILAYFWYTISSIPGGQTCCTSCCKSIVEV